MQSEYGYAGSLRGRDAVDQRARFITRTYNHLFGAIILFTLIELALFATGLAPVIARAMMGTTWLLVMGAFMLTSWIASRVAHTAQSLPAQYAALGGFVLAEAIVFVPLLLVFGSLWGATGAAGAMLASTVAFCALWSVLLTRIRPGTAVAPA